VNSVLEKGSSCAGLAPGDTDRVGPHGPYGVGRLILIRLHKNAGYARGYLIDNDVGLLVREAAALAANDVVAGSHYHLPLRAKTGTLLEDCEERSLSRCTLCQPVTPVLLAAVLACLSAFVFCCCQPQNQA
jgi:hypothetical protein